jgi:hypothetical protein
LFTPAIALLTFSTRAEQAAQVMPVTINFSFMRIPSFSYIIRDFIAKIKGILWMLTFCLSYAIFYHSNSKVQVCTFLCHTILLETMEVKQWNRRQIALWKQRWN